MTDPVCALHGKRWSEHEGGRCLYCCICFDTLTPEQCFEDESGCKWDLCQQCGSLELVAHRKLPLTENEDGTHGPEHITDTGRELV